MNKTNKANMYRLARANILFMYDLINPDYDPMDLQLRVGVSEGDGPTIAAATQASYIGFVASPYAIVSSTIPNVLGVSILHGDTPRSYTVFQTPDALDSIGIDVGKGFELVRWREFLALKE